MSNPHPLPHADRTPRTILVVEDEILIRMLISDELRDAGFEVIEAASADDALGVLASGHPIDLVFTDVRMPGSIDGAELASRIKKNHAEMQVILTSGHLPAHEALSIAPFIAKPYSIAKAIALIDATLGSISDLGLSA
ncbi:response regulator [Microvirga antarctica]|uniref:response regulator n=1 Tax=Microvirga antarctica TaxID=2819233 RepID=UPI0024848D72|nr:response regulator [Microvirga antarctica]